MTGKNSPGKETAQVYLKVHRRDNKVIYAFSDPGLIGNTYSDGKIRLKIRPEFYQGKLVDMEDALDLLKHHGNSNIVGSLVKHAVKRGLVHAGSVLRFKDSMTGKVIYHVMLMRV